MRHSKIQQQILTRDPEFQGVQAKGNNAVPLQIPALPFCQSILAKKSACKMKTVCLPCGLTAVLTLVLRAQLWIWLLQLSSGHPKLRHRCRSATAWIDHLQLTQIMRTPVVLTYYSITASNVVSRLHPSPPVCFTLCAPIHTALYWHCLSHAESQTCMGLQASCCFVQCHSDKEHIIHLFCSKSARLLDQ